MTPDSVSSQEREFDGMSKPVMTSVRESDMLSQKDGSKRQVKGSVNFLRSEVIKELAQYCGRINPSTKEVTSWPPSVANRWKNINKSNVRPKCIGGALRRLICKAFGAEVRERVLDLVNDHQLGMRKAGYRI